MAELSQKKYRFGYCVRRYNYWIFGITICSISLKYTIDVFTISCILYRIEHI